MNLRCFLGLHFWSPWFSHSVMRGFSKKWRKCQVCGFYQERKNW